MKGEHYLVYAVFAFVSIMLIVVVSVAHKITSNQHKMINLLTKIEENTWQTEKHLGIVNSDMYFIINHYMGGSNGT